VAGYRIDLYFPTLVLAVEIDEHGHEGYNPDSESDREAQQSPPTWAASSYGTTHIYPAETSAI
jgi:hypothetical protein